MNNELKKLLKDFFYKEDITGFQFTAGRTPRAIAENEKYYTVASLNFPRSVVIDGSESDIEEILEIDGLGEKRPEYTIEQVKSIGDQFTKFGYEYESGEHVGEWHWFRVKCTWDEIPKHLQFLKENLSV